VLHCCAPNELVSEAKGFSTGSEGRTPQVSRAESEITMRQDDGGGFQKRLRFGHDYLFFRGKALLSLSRRDGRLRPTQRAISL
jgi:hypothetical protein